MRGEPVVAQMIRLSTEREEVDRHLSVVAGARPSDFATSGLIFAVMHDDAVARDAIARRHFIGLR